MEKNQIPPIFGAFFAMLVIVILASGLDGGEPIAWKFVMLYVTAALTGATMFYFIARSVKNYVGRRLESKRLSE
jgi:hypothetical protein